MKIKFYKARVAGWNPNNNVWDDWDGYIQGSYFQMPKMNLPHYRQLRKDNIGHYIIRFHPGDWNMSNGMDFEEIDPATLEECGEWEVLSE